MAIDSRVAHGIAGRHLEDSLRASAVVMERFRNTMTKRTTPPATVKGARRELREMRSVIVQHSLWFAEGEDRHVGPWLAWLGAQGFGDKGKGGLQLHGFRITPTARRSRAVEVAYLAELRLHALARCLQRNGTLDWQEVKPILADAAAYAHLLGVVARAASFSQIAVSAGDHFFVGGLDQDGHPRLETYLRLDEALPSRWAAVRKAQLDALAAAGLERTAVYAGATYGDSPRWALGVAMLATELGCFRWLREKYDPKLDPISAAWLDYRNQATDAAVVGPAESEAEHYSLEKRP